MNCIGCQKDYYLICMNYHLKKNNKKNNKKYIEMVYIKKK